MSFGENPDPADAQTAWSIARDAYQQAVNDANDDRVARSALEVAYRGAILLASRNGVTLPPEGDGSYVKVEAMRLASRQWDEAGETEIAHNTFGLVARIKRMLNGPIRRRPLVAIMAAYIELGEKLVLLGWTIDGVWADFSRAENARKGLSAGGRNKSPVWQQAFAPVARRYCAERKKVSLGELVRLARTWAAEEQRDGRKVFLPSSAKGIEAGLKRLIKLGELIVPGRRDDQ